MRHGPGKPRVKSTHSRRVRPYLRLRVPATLLAVEGLVAVGVGWGDAVGRHLRQDKTVGADVTGTCCSAMGMLAMGWEEHPTGQRLLLERGRCVGKSCGGR